MTHYTDFGLPDIDYITKDEITRFCVQDPVWQDFRLSLKGISTHDKLERLSEWWEDNMNERRAYVQVVNYLNALKRGGQLTVEGNVQR